MIPTQPLIASIVFSFLRSPVNIFFLPIHFPFLIGTVQRSESPGSNGDGGALVPSCFVNPFDGEVLSELGESAAKRRPF